MSWDRRRIAAALVCALLILSRFIGWSAAKYVRSIAVTQELSLTITAASVPQETEAPEEETVQEEG